MENTLEIEIAEVRPKVLALTRKFFRASRLEGDPEDVVQDVLIRLWEARRSGADIRNPQAWAVTITKNACVSLWRKSRHNRQEPLPLPLSRETELVNIHYFMKILLRILRRRICVISSN